MKNAINKKEQMEIKEMNQTQPPIWLVNNILFCYEGDKHWKRKQHFLQHKVTHDSSQEAYTDDQRAQEGK